MGLDRENPHAHCSSCCYRLWRFFLDKNAKDRESQRAENDSKNQAIQIFFERISAILLERQVINLANSAKRLGP